MICVRTFSRPRCAMAMAMVFMLLLPLSRIISSNSGTIVSSPSIEKRYLVEKVFCRNCSNDST